VTYNLILKQIESRIKPPKTGKELSRARYLAKRKQKRNEKTLDEVVEYIVSNKGPDSERKAHHKFKKIQYSVLEQALQFVYESHPELSYIKPHHFKRIEGIWLGEKGKRNAREMLDEVIPILMQKYNWTLTDLLENIESKHFREQLTIHIPNYGEITYSAIIMLGVYDNTISTAILDWIKHNKDKSIREGYFHIKPYHFSKSPQGTWLGEKGKENVLQVTGEIIQNLRGRYGWSLTETINNIKKSHFTNEPLIIQTPDGILNYTSTSVLERVYNSSISAAIADYVIGETIRNQKVEVSRDKSIEGKIESLYPTFPEERQELLEVLRYMLPNQDEKQRKVSQLYVAKWFKNISKIYLEKGNLTIESEIPIKHVKTKKYLLKLYKDGFPSETLFDREKINVSKLMPPLSNLNDFRERFEQVSLYAH